MTRLLTRVLPVALLVLLILSVAVPAMAKGKDTAPAQICKEIDNTFPVEDERPFPFTIQSDGGCASSVAQGFDGTFENWSLSTSAFVSQCKFLEGMGIEYPYAFYGDPDLTANNRADCWRILKSFHDSLGG
ncbi:MAG: hypothetical protein AB1Z57_07210 [Acidimicrobiia bacterium]